MKSMPARTVYKIPTTMGSNIANGALGERVLTLEEAAVEQPEDGQGISEVADSTAAICTIECPLSGTKFDWSVPYSVHDVSCFT